MEALSLVSQLYMWVLVVLLFVGVGVGILGFVNYITDKLKPSNSTQPNRAVAKNNVVESKTSVIKTPMIQKNPAGDNNWLRFAAFSFLGFLFVITIIGFFSMKKEPQIANQHLTHQNPIYQNYYGVMNGMPYSNAMNHYDPYGSGVLGGYSGLPGSQFDPHMAGFMSNSYHGEIIQMPPVDMQNGLILHPVPNYQW